MQFDTICKLKKQHLDSFDEMKKTHIAAMQNLCRNYYDSNIANSSEMTTASFLKYFSQNFPVTITSDEMLVGTLWHWGAYASCGENRNVFDTNIGHYIADFENVLKLGVSGLISKAEKIKQNEYNKASFLTALYAFKNYIESYAQEALRLSSAESDNKQLLDIYNDCYYISENPPKTFKQALQLIWFTQIFLETEACSAAISFGRIDKYLYPYYKNDIKLGILSSDDALKLIMCFYIKASEGDESAMLTLGGDNTFSELSILFLKAQEYLKMRQPSVSVRINNDSSAEYIAAAEALAKTGIGMPAYFNDDAVVKGLIKIGIDKKSADDYGIVGCYEASPQGVYSNTVAITYQLYDSFYDFLCMNLSYNSFEEFLTAYQKHYDTYYSEILLPAFKKRLQQIEGWTSPFASCCLKGCLDTGLLAEQHGCDYMLLGLNILGIGVVIDSLYTIKKLVFDEQYITISELIQAAENNFYDIDLYQKIKTLKAAYGSDEKESNDLAEIVSELVGKTALRYKIGKNVVTSPALFWFTRDILQRNYRATLNGRKSGELLSYGIMPCDTPHKHPVTSMLNSAAHIKNEYFPNGCPLMLTLMPNDAEKDMLITFVMRSYFSRGGSHIAFNVADASTLKKAQEIPEAFENLMVKISGYSAKFATLPKEIQNAVIERAEGR